MSIAETRYMPDWSRTGRTLLHALALLMLIGGPGGIARAENLEQYLWHAGQNNPGVQARFLEYHAALERVPQRGALPDPQVSLGIFTMPMERYTGNQVAEISLMQMFPWFGTLSAAKDEATQMARARYAAFIEARAMLFYEVKARWHALYLLEQEVAVTEENLAILRMLEETARSRFTAGAGMSPAGAAASSSRGNSPQQSAPMAQGSQMGAMGGMQSGAGSPAAGSARGMAGSMNAQMGGGGDGGGMVEVLRVQMEIYTLHDRLRQLEDSRPVLRARFNTLLDRPADTPVVLDSLVDLPLPVALADLPDSIRIANPMLQMLAHEEAAYRAQETMARRMGFPMIGVGVQYGIFQPREGNPSMMNGKNMLMPMATVSIPLWRRKYTGAVREATTMRESIGHQQQDAANQLMVSHAEARREYDDAHRRSALYRQQIALTRQTLEILTVHYRSDASAFEALLSLQRQLLDYRLKAVEAQVDRNMAAAMLARLMGR